MGGHEPLGTRPGHCRAAGGPQTHLGLDAFGKRPHHRAEYFSEADKDGQSLGPRRIILITICRRAASLTPCRVRLARGLEVQVERIVPRHPTNAGLQWILDNAESREDG